MNRMRQTAPIQKRLQANRWPACCNVTQPVQTYRVSALNGPSPCANFSGMNSRLPASLTLSFTGFSQRGGCTDHHMPTAGASPFEADGPAPGKAARYFVDTGRSPPPLRRCCAPTHQEPTTW